MNWMAELPAWAALVTAILLFVGATMTLIGSLGLLRLKSFYERLHAPTLGTTLGRWLHRPLLDDLLLGLADPARAARGPYRCPCHRHDPRHLDDPGARGAVSRQRRTRTGRSGAGCNIDRSRRLRTSGQAFAACGGDLTGGTARMSTFRERRASSVTLPKSILSSQERP